MRSSPTITAALIALVLPSAVLAKASAIASLVDGQGKAVGTAIVSDHNGMLALKVKASRLPPGTHGLHLHAIGKCDGPAFTSAGPHWNPAGKQHGLDNPQGSHAGDLPNLIAGPNGKGRLNAMLHGADLTGLLDTDGAAVVIHAAADDLKTDPSGNSGTRIACGVLSGR